MNRTAAARAFRNPRCLAPGNRARIPSRRRFPALIFEDALRARLRKGFKRGYRSRGKIAICEPARRAERAD